MNKELIYNIIDNKIDKIIFKDKNKNYRNYTNNNFNKDFNILILALKLCKKNNLKLDLSGLYYNFEFNLLLKIFNYLITDTKIIKLNLSKCEITYMKDIHFKYITYEINEEINKKIEDDTHKCFVDINKYISYNQQSEDLLKKCKSFNNQEYNKNNFNNIINILNTNPSDKLIYNMFKNNKTLQSLDISFNSESFIIFILKLLIHSGNTSIKSLNIILSYYNLMCFRYNDYNYNKNSFVLRSELLNKNIITKIKMIFLQSLFNYYSSFKLFLKSLENNTSIKKFSFGVFNKYIFIILLNSIIKNKNIEILDISDVYHFNKSFKVPPCTYEIKYYNNVIFNNLLLLNNTIKTIIINKGIRIRCSNDNENIFSNLKYKFNKNNKYNITSNNNNLIIEDITNIVDNIKDLHLNLYHDIEIINKFDDDKFNNEYYINIKDYIRFIKNKNLDECINDEYRDYYKKLQDRLNSINFILKD